MLNAAITNQCENCAFAWEPVSWQPAPVCPACRSHEISRESIAPAIVGILILHVVICVGILSPFLGLTRFSESPTTPNSDTATAVIEPSQTAIKGQQTSQPAPVEKKTTVNQPRRNSVKRETANQAPAVLNKFPPVISSDTKPVQTLKGSRKSTSKTKDVKLPKTPIEVIEPLPSRPKESLYIDTKVGVRDGNTIIVTGFVKSRVVYPIDNVKVHVVFQDSGTPIRVKAGCTGLVKPNSTMHFSAVYALSEQSEFQGYNIEIAYDE